MWALSAFITAYSIRCYSRIGIHSTYAHWRAQGAHMQAQQTIAHPLLTPLPPHSHNINDKNINTHINKRAAHHSKLSTKFLSALKYVDSDWVNEWEWVNDSILHSSRYLYVWLCTTQAQWWNAEIVKRISLQMTATRVPATTTPIANGYDGTTDGKRKLSLNFVHVVASRISVILRILPYSTLLQ